MKFLFQKKEKLSFELSLNGVWMAFEKYLTEKMFDVWCK